MVSFEEKKGLKEFKILELGLILNNLRICPNCGDLVPFEEMNLLWEEFEKKMDGNQRAEFIIRMMSGFCNIECTEEYVNGKRKSFE